MLELRSVRKSYTTGDFTQVALDDVSLAFRDNEFVAILGPSGSGKTTLLNVVGGLDHYDSGNLVIDGVETSRYRDRDWDAYRNTRVGFVFQSYNLIPHQSVLANVELALTLAGISRAERRQRAIAALTEVGLEDHVHKRPSQLSGGQMQRVAIARALINDPEILLADEPTGALDSSTSVAIMGLLSGIARDRLVVMVTHNPELAEEYASRIVTLRDGVVVEDTDPFDGGQVTAGEYQRPKKTRMSFLTAVGLSFTNLMTKKGRTLMTSFAGSIGIIGIAAILALANGVNAYIKGVEEDTLSMYPLTIQSKGLDITSLLTSTMGETEARSSDAGKAHEVAVLSNLFSSVGSNDLASLKTFLEAGGDGIKDHTRAIEYSYAVTPQIFTPHSTRQVNPDSSLSALGLGGGAGGGGMLAVGSDVFNQLVSDRSLVDQQYDVVAGAWPQGADETVVVLSAQGGISDLALYAMGLRDPAELDEMVAQLKRGEDVSSRNDAASFAYQDFLRVTFSLVHASDYYVHDETHNVWTDKRSDKQFLKSLVDKGEQLKVVGVLRPKPDAGVAALRPGIYYTPALTQRLMKEAAGSAVVRDQLARPDTNVFSGKAFGTDEAADGFDLSSLFTVDEEAIKKAFTFDKSALALDTSALSGITMPQVKLDPSRLPQLDVEQLIGQLDLPSLVKTPDSPAPATGPTAAEVTTELGKVVAAYQGFAAAHQLDPAEAATAAAFAKDPAGTAAIGAAASALGVDPAKIESGLGDYLAFTAAAGIDPLAPTSGAAFLASPSGVALVASLSAPRPAAEGPVAKLVSAYLAYATANGLDPADMTGSFQRFAATSEGKQAVAGLAGLVDLDALQQRLGRAMNAYLGKVMNTYLADVTKQVSGSLTRQISDAISSSMSGLTENMSKAMKIDPDQFRKAFKINVDEQELAQLLMSRASNQQSSLDSNLRTLGYADLAEPSRIDLYPRDFEGKAQITKILDDYNQRAKAAGHENQVITYSDLVGTLMSSVTDIVNMVSYVLIAFVAISLIVSSIMIGVITYISVLERIKEIGVLRSIGASKGDIARVFNAETLIVGFVAGAMGVGITALLTIPANAIVQANFGVARVAVLPWQAAVILIAISMALTFVAGLAPSSAASRKDPVEALRSE